MSDSDLPEQDYPDENDELFNDAVAGEPVTGGVEDDLGAGRIEPLFAANDLEDEDIDLDDTLEWGRSDSAGTGYGLDEFDAGDLDTAGELDGLSDYDALTDDELAGTKGDGDRIEITEQEGPAPDEDEESDHDNGRML
jgi:hypothetical protein